MKPYILWLGAIFNEKQVLTSQAISPAANNWQSGLMKPIVDKRCPIIALGHKPEPIWPKGQIKMNYQEYNFGSFINGYLAGYLNIPFIRTKNLISKYESLLKKVLETNGNPKCVISYNPYPQNAETAMKLQNELQIPWICIIADMPTTLSAISKHNEYIARCDGSIFLSWDMYKKSICEKKFHLDGGIYNMHIEPNTVNKNKPKHIILYAGSLTKWGGVNSLIEAFKLIKREDIELWICGPGENSLVESESRANKNITFLGFLTKPKLEETYKTASIFVNPRPSSVIGNEYNFPSKLFEYLSYLKPIVSTKTPGISPEYEKVLVMSENESPIAISEKITEVLEWDESKKSTQKTKTIEFLSKNKTWESQVNRLSDWLIKEFSLNLQG